MPMQTTSTPERVLIELQHKKPSPQLTDDEFKQNMRAMND